MSFDIRDAYYSVLDTSPGTQVWSTVTGAYVANNAAAYLTWLTGGGGIIRDAVQGAANNGVGLIRLTVYDTTKMTTGEGLHVAGVTGTTEANGNWLITVIDATHIDLQASASVNAYVSGGTITGASRVDTKAEVNLAIIRYVRTAYPSYDTINRLGLQGGTTLTLTNQLASIITVTPNNAAGLDLKLPKANLPTSFPTNRPLRIIWISGASDLRIRDSADNLLATITYTIGDAVGRYYVELWLEDIDVSPGDWFVGPVIPLYDIIAANVPTLLSATNVLTVSNKNLDNSNTARFKDTNFTVQDNLDTTKQLVWQVSGVASASMRTWTVQNADITVAGINFAQTWTAAQNYGDGNFKLNGATSGALTQKAAAVAGTNTLTWPAGTTDFSATGGASQFLKQVSAGAAITVAQPATADLSDIVTFNLNTSGTIKSTNATAATSTITGAIVAAGGIGCGDRIYCASGFLAGAMDGSTAFTLFAAGGNRMACNVNAEGSGGTFTLYDYAAGSATQCLTAYKGSVIPGPGAVLATNATDGFAYVPSCAGVPTGTPTSFTGSVAIVYNSTDGRLYANQKPVAGWVFIESLSMTGASVNSSTFDTTFDDFMFVFSNLVPATNSVGIQMLVKSGGTYQTTTYLNQSGVTTSLDVAGTATVANTASKGISGVGYLPSVTSADYKMWGGYITVQQAAGTPARFNVDGYWNGGTGTITGVQFSPTSGNWTSGMVKIYGLRKS